MTDWELLNEFVRTGSQPAFGDLVARHLDWVYSAARRRVRDPHLAEDVAQAVFVVLARKAPVLATRSRERTVLSVWLFNVMRYTSANALRAERRRRRHEKEAMDMFRDAGRSAGAREWADLAPALDELVASLRGPERAAVLLRYYEGKSLAEVGARLGTSEEAARKRVTRAVERLRGMFARRGIAVPASALTWAILSHTVQAAPPGLAATASGAALDGSAAAAAGALVKGTLHALVLARLKTVAATAAGAVLAVGLSVLLIGQLLARGAGSSSDPAFASAGAGSVVALPTGATISLPVPQQAERLNLDREWLPVAWGRTPERPVAEAFAVEKFPDRVAFLVNSPGRLRVWYSRIDPPIDAAKLPILTLRYRADAALTKLPFYHLWLDDGRGPDAGGVSPFGLWEDTPIGDGREHELRADLRTRHTPRAPLVGLALAVSAGSRPIRYELLEIRFSSADPAGNEDSPVQQPTRSSGPFGYDGPAAVHVRR